MAQRHYLGTTEPGVDNWSISFPAFSGVISVGDTFAEVLEHGRDALASAVDAIQEALLARLDRVAERTHTTRSALLAKGARLVLETSA